MAKMRAAFRKLMAHGAEALQPRKVIHEPKPLWRPHDGASAPPGTPTQITTRVTWRRPMVSPREAATLRKAALRSGTYGTFDPETQTGWDAAWDRNLPNHEVRKTQSIRPPKEHKRQRTRESRAQHIEGLLTKADDLMETHYQEVEARKPPPGLETKIKNMISGKFK